MIPLYGFLKGDTIGLLMLADENETIRSLAEKLQRSARIRVAQKPQIHVLFQGKTLDLVLTVESSGLKPLDRFDVIASGDSS